MIHGEHGITFPLGSIAENSVGHVGAGEIGETGGVKNGDGGGNGGFFLVTEGSVFPGVWVQPADSDAWGGDAFFQQEICREPTDGNDGLLRE